VQGLGSPAEVVGWTMVALVSEYWRERLAAVSSGRRLLLLPDCPLVPESADTGVPHVCGPSCGITTLWAAARDQGWVVESTSQAVSAIGSLLTGQYDGVLGVARLSDLEKAFAMLPAFALPIAAVPYQPVAAPSGTCVEALGAAAIDVDWVLGLLRIAAGDAAPLLLEDVLAEVGAVGADVDVVGAFDHRAHLAAGLAAEAAGGHLATAEAAVTAARAAAGIAAGGGAQRAAVAALASLGVAALGGDAFGLGLGWLLAHGVVRLRSMTHESSDSSGKTAVRDWRIRVCGSATLTGRGG
jgi:hypothetical protein